MRVKRYFWNILISIDQFFNTLFGGDPDETISSRLGKNRDANWFTRMLSGFLDMFEWNHVEKSIEDDEGKDEVL